MTISADIIKDSINPDGIRLTTFQLRYPRLIHSELMTHRVFSRNASSSRAIPIQKQIENIILDPAEPVEWGSAQKGMQAGAPLEGWRLKLVRNAWHIGKWGAIGAAKLSLWAGAHKQIANRMLEPWSHISVLVSSTDWANFFALRNHKDADPTFKALAWDMSYAMLGSRPEKLGPNDWHLPYIKPEERIRFGIETLKKMSAARCARLSYLTHGTDRISHKTDLELFDRLAGSKPIHASPMEHQATPDYHARGNFRGWTQFRHFIEDNTVYD